MDVKNAEHKFKNAAYAHSIALEILKGVTPADTNKFKSQARQDEAMTWRKLGAARREFVEALSEAQGW